jgi:hypothetical protein
MVSIGKLKNMLSNAKSSLTERATDWADGQGALLKKEIGLRIAKMSAYWLFYGYNKPDIILGFLPLYTVQNIEVSRSHDILKYRAVRGEFMAHQKGGNVAVRIDFILTGDNQDYELLYLKGLQYWGVNETKKYMISASGSGDAIDYDKSSASIISRNSTKQVIPEASNGNITDMQQLDKENLGNTTYYEPGDYSYLEQKIHKTFTLYTRDEILYDMYIETLIYSRNIKEGSQNIHGTILLRHFVKPDVIKNVKHRQVTAPGLKTVKDGFEFKSDATTTLVQEVTKEKGIQKQTGDIDLAINATHTIFMSTLRYGIIPLNKYGSSILRSTRLESTYDPNLDRANPPLKKITIPTPVERSVTISTGPLNYDFKSYDVANVTEINAIDIASLLPQKLYSFDTYWLVNKYNTKLYTKYAISTIESISALNGVLNITYDSGSKICLCRIAVDNYNVTINDDGTGYTLRFINGNKYTLTIGNGKYAKLYFEVGQLINVYRLY